MLHISKYLPLRGNSKYTIYFGKNRAFLCGSVTIGMCSCLYTQTFDFKTEISVLYQIRKNIHTIGIYLFKHLCETAFPDTSRSNATLPIHHVYLWTKVIRCDKRDSKQVQNATIYRQLKNNTRVYIFHQRYTHSYIYMFGGWMCGEQRRGVRSWNCGFAPPHVAHMSGGSRVPRGRHPRR